MTLDVLSIDNLRKFCPLKWHDDIPDDGIAMGIADIDFKGPNGLVEFITTRLHEDMSFYGPYEGLPSAIEALRPALPRRADFSDRGEPPVSLGRDQRQ